MQGKLNLARICTVLEKIYSARDDNLDVKVRVVSNIEIKEINKLNDDKLNNDKQI